jgi:phosphatidylglycerophosphatase A
MAVKESSDELNPVLDVPATEPAPRAKRTAGDYFALALATCGVGFFPIAPGTLGSLVGVALFLSIHRAADSVLVPYALVHHLYYFTLESIQLALMLVVILIVTLAGIWAASRSETVLNRKDPGAVVIDEVAGQMIALLSASFFIAGAWGIVSAFILFRVFDIWKPYPIRRLESLESGLGVMADDVAAGLYAAIANSVLLAAFGIFSSRSM